MIFKSFYRALAGVSFLIGQSCAQSKTSITETQFDELHRYTLIQSASIPPICNNPPLGLQVVAALEDNVTDSRATIFRDDAKHEFIVSFPGTNFSDIKEVLGDLNIVLIPYSPPNNTRGITCDGCQVHAGFLLDWLSLEKNITNILQSNLAANKDYALKITGHSLGASLANLALSSLTAQGLDVSSVYTMGEPRIGNAAYSDHIDSITGVSDTTDGPGLYYRITHRQDPVPRLLPEPTYLHHQTEFFEATYQASAAMTFRCYGKEPQDCSDQYGNNTGPLAPFAGSTFIIDDHTYYTNVVLNATTTSCDA